MVELTLVQRETKISNLLRNPRALLPSRVGETLGKVTELLCALLQDAFDTIQGTLAI
jgi:hypothetical protein